MITSEQFIAQAAEQAQQSPQVVYVPAHRKSAGILPTILLFLALVGGAIGFKSGVVSITPLPPPAVTAIVQAPMLTVLPTPYALPAQPAPITGQAQVVVEPQAEIRVAATALPPMMTPDPNLTRLVAIINSTPTQIVAGPPECNSVNATYHAKTTVVDEKNIPIGVAEGWSCDSQAAAEAEMDRRANEMLHK